jgi:pantothenate kinase
MRTDNSTEPVRRARELIASGGRRILGITGAPGSGKSTLAATIVGELGNAAVCVPMDGFHLAQAELERLGRTDRKGAPDTFDAAGFVALLRRLRGPSREMVYAPAFDRYLEEPIAGAIPVAPEVRLVVVEGNYLLLTDRPWGQVANVLDECWYLDADKQVRIDRLVARHIEHGKAPGVAREWVLGSDERNAELIAGTRWRADLVVPLS